MDPVILIMAGGSMTALSVGAGLVLGWAKKAFHVELDPRTEAVTAALPGANCGGCGFVGCGSYAEAIVEQDAACNLCPVGGAACAEAVAAIMGREILPSWPVRPVVHCRATTEQRLQRAPYSGEMTCAAANLIAGVQGCTYGCLGLGDCFRACAFDAIHVIDGVAVVDYEACTGCGACAKVCPRNIISMVPFKADRMLVVGCSNKDFGKDVKAVCSVGCIGCKACQKASDLFRVDANLPTMDYDKYNPEDLNSPLAAVEKCPMKGLIFVGKPEPKDLAATRDQTVPALIESDFKTTVDQADWQG
ncbi:MAG: RnfABCDGE type electron transport complex subunit B [Kiritimatiellia bacterium]|nr:RnfABCDGE type electron transport complex subunit B [Kiritimatiellia bacterium]